PYTTHSGALHTGDTLERGRRIAAARRRHHFSHPGTIGCMATATTQTSAPAAAGGSGPTRGPAATPTLPRLAAVDIGTNSMRLVVAEVQPDGSYRVLDQDCELTRICRGLSH